MSSKNSNEAHIKQKRARSQLSCTACRQGKLRCNRASPCDQCIKRSKDSACTYLPPAAKSRSGQNVKGRIQHLEQSVVNLMNSKSIGGDNSNGSNDSSSNSASTVESSPSQRKTSEGNANSRYMVDSLPTEMTPPYSAESNISPAGLTQKDDAGLGTFGHLKISKKETSYVGSSHWAAILDSISELKRDLEAPGDESSEEDFDVWQLDEPLESDTSLPGLLHSPRRVTKAELLLLIPTKPETDRLVSLWFNSPHPFQAILHAPQFQNEYQQFWREPARAPVMWLGLLFAIMSLASMFLLRSWRDLSTPEAQAALRQATEFHELAASAAVLADYTKPKAYTIECLILYTGGFRTDNFLDVWCVMGVVLRLALRMGYHRDPSHYKNLSVFSGGMRRRVWHFLYMGDVLISFQLGLPAMMRSIQSDTQAPHNLFDSDFSINSKLLPPSRPAEESTPTCYSNSKVRLCHIFAHAADLSHAMKPPSFSEVMDLDIKLETARADLPPSLRYQTLDTAVTDSPSVLMCRFNLDLLHLKTKTVLHRRFMVSTASQTVQPYSRKCCIDSAMRTLRHHHTIYNASQPGGQLEQVSWYMGSIGTHDFLLASMIICLELGQQMNDMSDPQTDAIAIREDMIKAVETSKRQWEEESAVTGNIEPSLGAGTYGQNSSLAEVQKAIKALKAMLERVKKAKPTQREPVITSQGQGLSWMSSDPTTAACSFPSQSYSWQADQAPWDNQQDISMLGDILNVPDEINWEVWDHQLSGQQSQQVQDQYNWNLDDVLTSGVGDPELGPQISLDHPEMVGQGL